MTERRRNMSKEIGEKRRWRWRKVNVVDEGERGRDKQSSSLSQVHTPCNGIERVKQSE